MLQVHSYKNNNKHVEFLHCRQVRLHLEEIQAIIRHNRPARLTEEQLPLVVVTGRHTAAVVHQVLPLATRRG